MVLERLERLSSDPETRKAYEESINEQRNLTAIKEASIKEGHEEGRKEKAIEIAKNLLESGMPPMRVAEITKLDIEEIQSLEQANTSKY